MKHLLFFTLLFSINSQAQIIADFENISVPSAGFVNDAGLPGSFFSGEVSLPNFYDPNFQYWEGWAISNTTDTLNPGFTNQYSAIAGGGAENSANYAVGYAYNATSIFLVEGASGTAALEMYITNNAYAYYSMKDGDAFSKKFGGESGNDPDFFKLTIRGYNNGQLNPDSIEFFLADYRFANNSLDYIVKDWVKVDLKVLGAVEEIQFSLSSSDNGQFGMNTPAYFCADRLTTKGVSNTDAPNGKSVAWGIFPNPAHGFTNIYWDHPQNTRGQIYSLTGQLVKTIEMVQGLNRVDLSGFPSGVYLVKIGRTSKVLEVR